MHEVSPELEASLGSWLRWALTRVTEPLDGVGLAPGSVARSAAITADGLGADEAWRRWRTEIGPSNLALDSERFFAFLPIAPTPVATVFDMVVSASALGAESWLEAAGAIDAENEVLTWLAGVFGMPPSAGGCFVSGGSAGNLSALAVARDEFRRRTGRWDAPVIVSEGTHSSIATALHLLDMEAVVLPGQLIDPTMLTAERLGDAAAVVATAGTTNAGLVDDLAAIGAAARASDVWFHVDGAYGAAAAIAPSTKELFAGLGLADSIVVDPHKWLFGPLDCGALIYRDPSRAMRTHRQHASYLDPLQTPDAWNPSDLAFHLTRRARGLPLWMSLAVHGADAYSAAIERTLDTVRAAARLAAEVHYLDLLLEPQLSVLLVRRHGWGPDDYYSWSRRLLDSGQAVVMPTMWQGELVARFACLHPAVTVELFAELFDSMR